MTTGPIVVGVDGSESSLHALRWAAREAHLRGAPLTALFAWDYLHQHGRLGGPFDPDYDDAQARRDLAELVERAFPDGNAPAGLEQKTVCDFAAPSLLAEARNASLLVLGARGLGGVRGALLGSVSQHCLHHLVCPTAIVREGLPEGRVEGERIVVGVDGSGTALDALHWALDEAVARRARLEVVTAWHVPYIGEPTLALDPETFEDAARTVVADAVSTVDVSRLEQPPEQIVTMGGAAGVLLDAAKGADLVVLGSRGRGGFLGLLLGSVSHQVAHHATCPVVVVPPSD